MVCFKPSDNTCSLIHAPQTLSKLRRKPDQTKQAELATNIHTKQHCKFDSELTHVMIMLHYCPGLNSACVNKDSIDSGNATGTRVVHQAHSPREMRTTCNRRRTKCVTTSHEKYNVPPLPVFGNQCHTQLIEDHMQRPYSLFSFYSSGKIQGQNAYKVDSNNQLSWFPGFSHVKLQVALGAG